MARTVYLDLYAGGYQGVCSWTFEGTSGSGSVNSYWNDSEYNWDTHDTLHLYNRELHFACSAPTGWNQGEYAGGPWGYHLITAAEVAAGSFSIGVTASYATSPLRPSFTVTATPPPTYYTVSFDSLGGSAVADQSVIEDGLVTEPADPTYTGYNFGGWYKEYACTNPWDFDVDTVTADTTLYAKWTAIWTVAFDSHGGSAVSSQIVESGTKATEPADPTYTNHIFDGWYTNTGYTDLWLFDYYLVTADITLHAKWAVGYTVTFNSQGGSAVTSQSVISGGYASAPTPPTRAGYLFGGWYTEAGCYNVFSFSTAILGNKTLYAKWTSSFTVTFDSQGGSAVGSQTVEQYHYATEPTAPANGGYNFGGWYNESGCTTAFVFATTPITANKTVYAKWTASFPVMFDSQGGSVVASQTISIGGYATMPAKPTKLGYNLVGWYAEAACTNIWVFATHAITGITTIYAKWVVNTDTRKVTFDSQGGTDVASQVVFAGGIVAEPIAPTKASNTFGSWCKDKTGVYPWNFSTEVVTVNITLYAKWVPVTYTVMFNTMGGSAVADQTINGGEHVRKTVTPNKSGCIFYAWYSDIRLTALWSYPTDTVSADMVLYAKWIVSASITDDLYICGTNYSLGMAVHKNVGKKLGTGITGEAYCMARAATGDLYVCGRLSIGSATPRNSIYRWDGTSWSLIGIATDNYAIRSIVTTANGDLYAGGDFTSINDTTVKRVAKWDGTEWTALSTGLDYCARLIVFNDTVYACGWQSAGLAWGTYLVLRWNGYAWIAVGPSSGSQPVIEDLALSSEVYALDHSLHPVSPSLRYLSGGTWTTPVDYVTTGIAATPNGDVIYGKQVSWSMINLLSWDGTDENVLAATSRLSTSTRLKYLTSGVLACIAGGDSAMNAFLFTEDSLAQLIAGGDSAMNAFLFTEDSLAQLITKTDFHVTDVCYAKPSNPPTPGNPDDPDDPDNPDKPGTPGDHHAYWNIYFNVVDAPPPDDPDSEYCYRTIIFSINEIVDPPEETGYCYKVIYFDVLDSGSTVESDTKLITFDVTDGADQDVLIEFTISGVAEIARTITFYVNTSVTPVGVPMSLRRTSGTQAAGNKAVSVKIYQNNVLVATADALIKVIANSGIAAEISRIPQIYGTTMRVDGYVKGTLVYTQTMNYAQSIGVQLV